MEGTELMNGMPDPTRPKIRSRMFRTFFWNSLCLVLALSSGSFFAYGKETKSAEKELVARRQRVELMNYFLRDPYQATMPQTPIAIELYNQAVEHFERQDYELARQVLNDSITYDARNPFAYELLADIDYLENHLEEAHQGYRKAYVLRPNDPLKKKIIKISRERRAEEKLETDEQEKFILKYDGTLGEDEGAKLREILEDTYLTLSRDFGYS